MAVYHTTFRGTIASGTVGEEFSHSMGIETSATSQAVATALHDSWATAWAELSLHFPSSVTYTDTTAAQVINPEVPDLGAAFHAPFTPPLQGGNLGLGILPSQCAIAVSLTAGVRPDGRPFKGRFYLPPISASLITSDGLLAVGTTDAIAATITEHIDRLAAQEIYPVVWSRVTEDLVNRVSLVRVGNRVDTIRSRRNRFPETYSVVAPIPPG